MERRPTGGGGGQKQVPEAKNLGVLYTGYLDKKQPTYVSTRYKRRFVVLTQNAVHWFNRAEGCDLFGEERGQVGVGNIVSVRILDEDAEEFVIKSTGGVCRYFKAASTQACEEWVSAILSCCKVHESENEGLKRRATISNFRGIFGDADEEQKKRQEELETQVSVLLVSVKSLDGRTEREVVLARNPEWNRLIRIPDMKIGECLMISTSNGGVIELSHSQLLEKAFNTEEEFDAHITGVPLASSLRIVVLTERQATQPGTEVYNHGHDAKKTGKNLLVALFSDREGFLVVLLSSLMLSVIAVSAKSLLLTNSDAMLLSSIAILLASVATFQSVRRHLIAPVDFETFHLYINKHVFTSPEAPLADDDDAIPQRFIIGCANPKAKLDDEVAQKEALKEARRRWDITREWRKEEKVNEITDTPQPHFNTIKENYPFYWCGRGKKEGHLVFYERPGELNRKELIERLGLTVDDMIRHWLFVTEYQWKYLAPDEMAKTISIIDMEQVSMFSLTGEPYKFLNQSIKLANAHYPERSYIIFIANAPGKK